MGLLDTIGNKLAVYNARKQLDSGTIGNAFFVRSPETQRAVRTLKELGTPEDRWRADRFEDVRENGLDLGRELRRMGL